MSEGWDGEPVLQYHRISATAVEPFLVMTPRDFPQEFNDSYWHIKSLLGHKSAGIDGQWQAAPNDLILEFVDLKFFGIDGQRRTYTCFMDEDGIQKQLDANHRANAMVDAGRFTSLDGTVIDDCKNQRLKEHQGSNYFYGDVVVVIPEGGVAPDHGVYGSDPISFIIQERPSSQVMVDTYGGLLAKHKISHNIVMDLTDINRIKRTHDIQWTQKPYKVAPFGMSDTMRALLQSWNS